MLNGIVTSVFGDDINTDAIIPAFYLVKSDEPEYFATYAFAKFDPDFRARCLKCQANIIVAGKNFGCGSSREQAVYALQFNRVICVIAQSFPDIFYRNSLANGLPLIIVQDISGIGLNDQLEIDLDTGVIHNRARNASLPFQMKIEDRRTIKAGGMTALVRTHLEEILAGRGRVPLRAVPTERATGQTLVEKIVSRQAGRPVHAGDKLERLPITKIFFNDVIAPSAIKLFRNLFGETFKKCAKPLQVFDPRRLFFNLDHSVPAFSVEVAEGIDRIECFGREQGAKVYREGDGIEHVVLVEDGHIVPWDIVAGSDSHTCTEGAIGALGIGVGTTEGVYALASGYLYDFEVPETTQFELTGAFPQGVYAKDLMLHIIGKMGAGSCSRRVAEFVGDAVRRMTMDARNTICNMAVELSARTGIMPYDETLAAYLEGRAQWPVEPIAPDPDARYADRVTIDLSTLEPMIAFPHKTANVAPVSRVQEMIARSREHPTPDFPAVPSDKITDAFLGTCTNGRYEDLAEAAKVLRGHKVHPDVSFVVIPASRRVYERAMDDGILQVFVKAGANVEASNCGPCIGGHMGVLSANAQMISSSNRNYQGRMGSRNARIFLASPSTVTASAIEGRLADPRRYL